MEKGLVKVGYITYVKPLSKIYMLQSNILGIKHNHHDIN